MRLGELVKQYRDAHDISMDSFAEKSGLSKGYISMLEKGIRPGTNKVIIPSIETIKKVAVGMNSDFNEIFSIVDDDQEVALEDTQLEEAFRIDNINSNHYNREPESDYLDISGLTSEEKQSIIKYLGLDMHSKKIVDYIIKEEYNRLSSSAEKFEQEDHAEIINRINSRDMGADIKSDKSMADFIKTLTSEDKSKDA